MSKTEDKTEPKRETTLEKIDRYAGYGVLFLSAALFLGLAYAFLSYQHQGIFG